MQYLIGVGCAFGYTIMLSFIIVITRKMRKIHFSVILFYYGLIAAILLALWLAFEYTVDFYDQFKDGLRLTTYDQYQWLLILGCLLTNTI